MSKDTALGLFVGFWIVLMFCAFYFGIRYQGMYWSQRRDPLSAKDRAATEADISTSNDAVLRREMSRRMWAEDHHAGSPGWPGLSGASRTCVRNPRRSGLLVALMAELASILGTVVGGKIGAAYVGSAIAAGTGIAPKVMKISMGSKVC